MIRTNTFSPLCVRVTHFVQITPDTLQDNNYTYVCLNNTVGTEISRAISRQKIVNTIG
jgi:hypothetical protein